MNRQALLANLQTYFASAFDDTERAHVLATIHFIRNTQKAFERDHEALGHVTASALVVSEDGNQVLLNKHAITKRYINFGGHCEGEENVEENALRELEEEAGITVPQTDGIFDVDIHYVAPHIRQGQHVPPHLHYDISYLFRVPANIAFKISEESDDIRWFPLEEVLAANPLGSGKDGQMHRMFSKIKHSQAA